MSKIIFMKYLPPVRPKMVLKIKMLRIYWSLALVIFRISRSQFWSQKLFLLSTYHLFGPNWSQNSNCSEFIEIWHIQYLKYANLDFDVKTWFLLDHLLGPNWFQNWKCSGFIKIWHIWYFKYRDLDFYVKHDFSSNIYQLLGPNWSQNEKCSEFIEIW